MNNNNNNTTATVTANLLNKCNENNLNINGNGSSTNERQCANCATTTTPLWRKYGSCHFLCNACGLYYRVNGDHRPHVSKISRVSTLRKSFLHCANCGTNKTTMWRRDAGGVHVCNACGLFYRINGFNRPVSMRRDVIRTRKRRDKELMQAQDGSLVEQSMSMSINMDIQPIEMSVSDSVNIKLEDTAKPCSSLSSSSVSSNESCSYNYVDTNQTQWTTNDVNPLTYIFTESIDYYNTEHSGMS